MKKSITVIMMCLLFIVAPHINLLSQDIHFSQFDKAGFTLNPAMAGSYYGTARVGGIYRDQYRKAVSESFSTTLLFVDAPLFYVDKKQKSWIGLGANLFVDKVGMANLKKQAYSISAAYHYGIDDNMNNVVTLAGSLGYSNRVSDLRSSSLFFENEINNNGTIGQTSLDRNIFSNNISYLDFGVGAKLISKLSEKSNLSIGTGVFHLNTPTVSLGSDSNKMPVRMNVHVGLHQVIGPKIDLSPKILFSKMGNAQQLQIQTILGYKMNEKVKIKGGLGMRVSDAAQLFVGAEFSNFDVGLSYDYTISKLTNVSTGGAIELFASYVFVNEKKISSTPIFICPQL